MKGLEHDAREPHILAGRHLDAPLERTESVTHDAQLMPAGADRRGNERRVPG